MHSLARRFAPAVAVPLAVAAALTLSACGKKEPAAGVAKTPQGPATSAAATAKPLPVPPPAKYVRDHYSRLEDCVFDWGYAGKCVPVPPGAPEKAQGVAFFGPIYSNAMRLESQLASRREALEQGYVQHVDESPSDKSSARSDVKA